MFLVTEIGVSPALNVTDDIEELLNIDSPKFSIEDGIVMLHCNEEQYEKAEEPISLSDVGRFISVSVEHPKNAELPIVSTVSGIVILFSFVQFEKAASPILIRFSGKIM